MAEKYQFINGVLGNDFLQQKTTDNIYLKDLLEQEIYPLLETYNSEQQVIERLLCYRYDDAVANSKQLFTSSTMRLLGNLEQPKTNKTMDSWNRPVPIARYGDATGITSETLKQMSSAQLTRWSADILLADKKNLIKQAFAAMMTSAPAGKQDELTAIAATPKAFWNADGVDVPRPNGQITFVNTHQHYISSNGIGTAGADIATLIAKVTEHEGMDGTPILWAQPGASGVGLIQAETTYYRGINLPPAIIGTPAPAFNQSGIIQALVTGFAKIGFNVTVVGTWKNAIVVSCPDIPANYVLCTMFIAENSPLAPLAWREHPQFKGLLLWSDSGSNPIIGVDAQYRRYLGYGVWERSAGACWFNASNATWVDPTFV